MFRKIVKAVTTQKQRAFVMQTFDESKNSWNNFLDERKKSREVKRDKFLDFQAPYRLHLGCGNIKLEGFCNVDVLETIAVDVVDDIRLLQRFPDASVGEIYACHVLEHFSHDEIGPILSRWFDILQPGGVLRISVPDIDRIVRIYYKNFEHFEKPGHSPWVGLIYGGQSTPYDYHKTGFNAC